MGEGGGGLGEGLADGFEAGGVAGGGEVGGAEDVVGAGHGVGLGEDEDAEILEEEFGVGESADATETAGGGTDDGGGFVGEGGGAVVGSGAAKPVEGVLVEGREEAVVFGDGNEEGVVGGEEFAQGEDVGGEAVGGFEILVEEGEGVILEAEEGDGGSGVTGSFGGDLEGGLVEGSVAGAGGEGEDGGHVVIGYWLLVICYWLLWEVATKKHRSRRKGVPEGSVLCLVGRRSGCVAAFAAEEACEVLAVGVEEEEGHEADGDDHGGVIPGEEDMEEGDVDDDWSEDEQASGGVASAGGEGSPEDFENLDCRHVAGSGEGAGEGGGIALEVHGL